VLFLNKLQVYFRQGACFSGSNDLVALSFKGDDFGGEQSEKRRKTLKIRRLIEVLKSE